MAKLKPKTEAKTITLKAGDAAVTIAANLAPHPKAGKLTLEELSKIPTARPGVGVVCVDVVDAMRRTGSDFTPPKGITGAVLTEAGERAEGYDRVIESVESLLVILKQANRISDGEVVTMLSRVYDQVKTQAKDDPTLKVQFSSLFAYFANGQKAPAKKPANG